MVDSGYTTNHAVMGIFKYNWIIFILIKRLRVILIEDDTYPIYATNIKTIAIPTTTIIYFSLNY